MYVADVLFGLPSASVDDLLPVEDQRPSTDRHCSLLDVVVMANQRCDLCSEDALQEEDPRSKARGHPHDQDRRVVAIPGPMMTRRRNGEDVSPSTCARDVTEDRQ